MMNRMGFKRVILMGFLLSTAGFLLHSQGNSQQGTLRENADSIEALVSYTKDGKGFWVKRPPMTVTNLPDSTNVTIIGKNNGSHSVYGLTSTSILQFFFSKENYSPYKKDKLLSNLKEKDWEKLYFVQADLLENSMQILNDSRNKELADSIDEVRRMEALKADEAARREALRQDSIRAAEAEKQMRLEDEEYRKTHSKGTLDLSAVIRTWDSSKKRELLKCIISGCGEELTNYNLTPIALKGDTLVCLDFKEGVLGIMNAYAHAIRLTDDLKKIDEVSRHIRAWGDTLRSMEGSASDLVEFANYVGASDYISDVKKKAPNGFIEDWGWNYEYGPVSFNVTYCNTNKKTIKYLKFYFTVYNDVNDVRGRGHVSCTGPLEEFESGSWSFDRTGCWPAGDATTMKITKVVLTYMNGSTVTLTGKNIKYN